MIYGTVEHLVYLVADDGEARAEVPELRVQADSTTAHRLARANGFKNYDLVKRVIFQSGKHNDIGVNCVRDRDTWDRMQRAASVRDAAHRAAYEARRDA